MEPVGRVRRRVGSGSRRSWTYAEEKVLVAGLKELVARGMKCDNGFKAGYGGILEQMLNTAFPGTDLKSDPHILSKIHTWKKQYASLKLMLSNSGIGLNSTTYRIDASLEQWERQIKADPNARGLKNKSFPFYDDWCEIFGKDRATGDDAQGFSEAVQEILNNTSLPSSNNVFEGAGESPIDQPSNAVESEFTQGESSFSTKMKGKSLKRKLVDELDDRFLSTMNNFCEKSDVTMNQIAVRMGELAERVGAEFDATKKRGLVYQSLGLLDIESLESRVQIALYLCNHPKELDVFFSLPDDAKSVMVRNIIKKDCDVGDL